MLVNGASRVAAIIREAVDRTVPTRDSGRQAAMRIVQAAEPMPTPSVEALRREVEDARSRGS